MHEGSDGVWGWGGLTVSILLSMVQPLPSEALSKSRQMNHQPTQASARANSTCDRIC